MTHKQRKLINGEYLKQYSILPRNYDLTEIDNFIPIAESVHIEPIIGKALYEELLDQVQNNNLTNENSTLLLEIYKVEGIAVVYEALPFLYANITSVGITKGKSDNSDSIDNKDITYLNTHLKSQLDFAKRKLKEFLDDNSNHFPKYAPIQNESINNQSVNIFAIPKDFDDFI